MSSRMCIESKSTAVSGTKKRLSLFAIAVTLSVMTAQPFAIRADAASNVTGAGPTAGKSLQADDIHDVAFTLQRIRQQAINVFVEATRKKVDRYELNIPSLSSMPTTPLEDQKAYLPLRKGWLVFFVGTMEPLVQILNEHLKHLDERTAQSGLPSQYLPEWHGIVNDWKGAIKGLNDQLNICASLVDDPSSGNVEVATAARSMDSQITALDGILNKASKFLQGRIPQS